MSEISTPVFVRTCNLDSDQCACYNWLDCKGYFYNADGKSDREFGTGRESLKFWYNKYVVSIMKYPFIV
jgi:hypothetical protein